MSLPGFQYAGPTALGLSLRPWHNGGCPRVCERRLSSAASAESTGRRRTRHSLTRSCLPVEKTRRELDPRGFVLPRPGELVLFPGRWADEDCAGLVENVRPRVMPENSSAPPSSAGSIVDVVEMRGVGDQIFETTRSRRWFDVAEVRLVADAQYLPERDAYRIPSARSGYSLVSPMDPETKARADAEYAALKQKMRRSTTVAGICGTVLAALAFPGTDAAIGFGLGSVASLLYLTMLQLSVDDVGRVEGESLLSGLSRFVAGALALRFIVPALPFIIQGLLKGAPVLSSDASPDLSSVLVSWLGCLSREQAAFTVLGLLTYKVPLWRQTGAEAVDSLAEMPLNTGTTGMIGTTAGLVARAFKRKDARAEESKSAGGDAGGALADKPFLFVFAGPSGVGKSSLIERLFRDFPNGYDYCVSHTTRSPRTGEVDGVDYNFATSAEFSKMVDEGRFVEHAMIHGNYYGTSFESILAVLDSGKSCVLDLDVQGVQALSEKTDQPWRSRFVWIAPPSLESLRKRLESRGTESPESLAKRIDTAMREISYAATTNVFDRTIVNEDLDVAYKELVSFIDREKQESSHISWL